MSKSEVAQEILSSINSHLNQPGRIGDAARSATQRLGLKCEDHTRFDLAALTGNVITRKQIKDGKAVYEGRIDGEKGFFSATDCCPQVQAAIKQFEKNGSPLLTRLAR